MTKKVKISLIRKSLRIADLADHMGTTKGYVSRVLNGQKLGKALRPRIAFLLGLPEEVLAREIDKAKLSRQGTRK